MGPGYQTQVKDQEQLLQPGISSEARLKQKDTDSGHESGDQNQQSHVSYILIEETEEERDKRTESEGNIEDVAREDIDLDDQEMEIGYESEDQDQNSVKLSSEAREDKNRQTDLVSDQIDIAVEDEIEIELADYEMEIGYESDEQYQDSDISGKGVSEERTQTGEAVEDGIEFEAEPEEGFELNDQEMEINYETDDQEQHSQKTNESKDHEEQDSQTEIAEDARSPVNATSQQFWSQLVDSARTTSLSSKTSKQRQERTTKQFGSASHHGEGIGRYAKRVEERLEVSGERLELHTEAQEDNLETLSSQAYSPFTRSPAPELPSPVHGFGPQILPVKGSGSLVKPSRPIFEPDVFRGFGSLNQVVNQASEQAKKLFQLNRAQTFQPEIMKEQFVRMNEVLGPISEFAASVQAAQKQLGSGSRFTAPIEREIDHMLEDRTWSEMKRLRQVALGRLADMDKAEGKPARKGGSWREEWKEALRTRDGEGEAGGLVYVLTRIWVDGDGKRSEDGVEIEVPMSSVIREVTEGGQPRVTDPVQLVESDAEAQTHGNPGSARYSSDEKMIELFGDEQEMEWDDSGVWDDSSDVIDESLDPEIQEIGYLNTAVPGEYRGMSDEDEEQQDEEEQDYGEEDEDFLDSE
ncbi:hypothetical protein ONS95_002689 [Cadophora gregata]|uniref:uncharacterized protein n=1 Tax=Cadophora gregata TaxID=51156 RepID=UPI0026DB3CF2|nr:uncharacterized protein ONS95_002689 [Cadophora gregata]KAK0110028.1 hypothetical protein ONS95_002689 [Cadophora gregata]